MLFNAALSSHLLPLLRYVYMYMLMYIWGSYIWYCMYRAHNCCQCEWVENGGCCRRQAIKMEKHVCGEA